MTEARVAHDLVSADLARVLAEVRSLEVRAAETQDALRESSAEVLRLRARLQASEDEQRETRASATAARPASPPAPAVIRPAPPPAKPPAAVAPPRAPIAPAPIEREQLRGGVSEAPAEQVYAAALKTFRAHEHGQAVLDFLDFIAKYPTHALAPNAQYWIGEAYWAQRDYRQALFEFQRVARMAPKASKVPDSLVKIGMCHAKLREPDRAAEAWQRVVRDYPRSDAAGKARGFLRARAVSRQP